MRLLKNRQNLLSIGLLTLLLALAVPGTAFADQRERSGHRDNERHDRNNRKCGKFVNCHDARDGRWDGKGPRRDRDRRFSRRHRSNDRWDRGRNRTDRMSGVREVNRTNTARFRRTRG